MIQRDENGVMHVVALSGGHDSTALALLLAEREPRPYNYVCTPTGDELPEMFAHWRDLGERLGSRIIPVVGGTLKSVIAEERALPNFKLRFCTRKLKIIPYRNWLLSHSFFSRTVSYVGLRADEEGRAGGAYDDIAGVETRFPLREWGMGEDDVQATLRRFGVKCPDRTDCARCYHQRIGEWFELWRDHRDLFDDAVLDEATWGATYRTPGRDSWPTSLAEMGARFAAGDVPTLSLNRIARERMAAGAVVSVRYDRRARAVPRAGLSPLERAIDAGPQGLARVLLRIALATDHAAREGGAQPGPPADSSA